MALSFLFRWSEDEEKIVSDHMKILDKDTTKTLKHIVNQYPVLNKENRELREENRRLQEENRNLNKLIVSKQHVTDIENLIKYVERNFETTVSDLKKLKSEVETNRAKSKPDGK